MSDILIKDMEMPKGNDVLIVDSAGTIAKLDTWTGKREAINPLKVKAIELPPHGRLVDIDQLIRKFRLWGLASVRRNNVETADLLEDITETDIVLEAST